MLAACLLITGTTWAQDKAQENAQENTQAPVASLLSGWVGQEFTVTTSSDTYLPSGGKLTFAFDNSSGLVRVCTRTVAEQRASWKMDLGTPCGVTMTFTRGTRYCTEDDVKAGNAEVLASCHRLRSRDVAMRTGETKGAVELNDMIAFLLDDAGGKKSMAILVDSPSRMTRNEFVIIRP